MINHTVFIKKESIGRKETYWLRSWQGWYSREDSWKAVQDFARHWGRQHTRQSDPMHILVVSDEVIREFELVWPPTVQVKRVTR